MSAALRPATALAVAASVAATVAGCGGGGDDDAGAAGSTTKTPAPTTTQTPSPTTSPGDQGWERVVPGGDCQCSDGSEFSFWVRKANPDKVLCYFRAGGACFSAETCAQDGSTGAKSFTTPRSARGAIPRTSLSRLIAGEPVEDVHCTQCRAG
jgi:hypothetical protein